MFVNEDTEFDDDDDFEEDNSGRSFFMETLTGRGTTVYRIIRFKECIQCIAWSDSRGPVNP